jgi:hypothetical protein
MPAPAGAGGREFEQLGQVTRRAQRPQGPGLCRKRSEQNGSMLGISPSIGLTMYYFTPCVNVYVTPNVQAGRQAAAVSKLADKVA